MKIQINNPCHESWDGMSPDGNGRHCAACEKIVVDFTSMKDEEIIHFFHRPKKEKVCGRFSSTQVGRVLVEQKAEKEVYTLGSLQDWPIRMNGNFFGLVLFFAVASSLASCGSKTTGEVSISKSEGNINQPDLNHHKDSIAGKLKNGRGGDQRLPAKVVPTNEKINCVIPDIEDKTELKGEVEVVQLMGDTTFVE